ncbi:hypothetical protein ACJZ2D_004259 [Fusarium nematophilum]
MLNSSITLRLNTLIKTLLIIHLSSIYTFLYTIHQAQIASPAFALEQTILNAIRSLPTNTYFVHATNCIAEWGAGIAAELAVVFPASLGGRCLVIPPQPADVARGAPNIHIICLFTSCGYGRPNRATGKPGKDNTGKILAQTEAALKEMRVQLEAEAEAKKRQEENAIVIYSPMLNSGALRVPWGRTAAVIEKSFEGWDGCWLVLEPPK